MLVWYRLSASRHVRKQQKTFNFLLLCQTKPECPFFKKTQSNPIPPKPKQTGPPPPPKSQSLHIQEENRGEKVRLSVSAITAAVLLVKEWKAEQKRKDGRTVQISHACVWDHDWVYSERWCEKKPFARLLFQHNFLAATIPACLGWVLC